MGKWAESWSRWFGEGGPGGRWPRLGDGQAQLARYLLLLLGLGVLLLTLSSRDAREAGGPDPRGTPTVAVGGPGGPGGPGAAGVPAASTAAAGPYARELEGAVREFLEQLHGVGRVHVRITLATGPELVLAEQVNRERRVSEEPAQGGAGATRTVIEERHSAQPVILRRDQGREEQALVLLERAPQIQGVVVVVDAADSRLPLEISRAVATFLGVPVHKVYVLAQQP
ncbi:MAG TPA: hypothetical protein VIK93_08585 [Limnochordales bacterium]